MCIFIVLKHFPSITWFHMVSSKPRHFSFNIEQYDNSYRYFFSDFVSSNTSIDKLKYIKLKYFYLYLFSVQVNVEFIKFFLLSIIKKIEKLM